MIKSKLTTWQIERLCNIIYLNGLLQPHQTIGELLQTYRLPPEHRLPVLLTLPQWQAVVNSVLQDRNLYSLKVVEYQDGVAYLEHVAGGIGYIIFRGTSSDNEWYDNGLGMLIAETQEQQKALQFVETMQQQHTPRQLVVAGHSKGGNKAQYCLFASNDDIVDWAVSIDGQGFSTEFHKKYKILSRLHKLTTIAERRDFVNCLGIYAKRPNFYSGYRADPLPYYHCPDALRSTNSTIILAEHGYIPEAINKLIANFLTNKKYKNIKKDTVEDIIAIMIKNDNTPPTEKALAITRLIIVFIDMFANNELFNAEIESIILKEPAVIVRTFKQTNGGTENKVFDLVRKKLIAEIVLNPSNLVNFMTAKNKLRTFLTEELSKPINVELYEYLNGFLHYVSKRSKAEKAKNT